MKLKGKKITSVSNRKVKRNDSIRYCAEKKCTTTLSIYNRKDKCFLHSPKSFPRNRGHIKREQGV